MISLNIIARTEIGTTALKKHVEESMKMNRLKKAMLKKMGFMQEVMSTNPYTLYVYMGGHLGNMTKEKHFIEEIAEALAENGAKLDRDYNIQRVGGEDA